MQALYQQALVQLVHFFKGHGRVLWSQNQQNHQPHQGGGGGQDVVRGTDVGADETSLYAQFKKRLIGGVVLAQELFALVMGQIRHAATFCHQKPEHGLHIRVGQAFIQLVQVLIHDTGQGVCLGGIG